MTVYLSLNNSIFIETEGLQPILVIICCGVQIQAFVSEFKNKNQKITHKPQCLKLNIYFFISVDVITMLYSLYINPHEVDRSFVVSLRNVFFNLQKKKKKHSTALIIKILLIKGLHYTFSMYVPDDTTALHTG